VRIHWDWPAVLILSFMYIIASKLYGSTRFRTRNSRRRRLWRGPPHRWQILKSEWRWGRGWRQRRKARRLFPTGSRQQSAPSHASSATRQSSVHPPIPRTMRHNCWRCAKVASSGNGGGERIPYCFEKRQRIYRGHCALCGSACTFTGNRCLNRRWVLQSFLYVVYDSM